MYVFAFDRARVLRTLQLILLAGVCALSACSGCDAEEGPCPEVPCGIGSRCVEGQCISITDVLCFPSCASDEICERGECLKAVARCTATGQICDPFRPSSGDFYCVDWDGFNVGEPPSCSAPCSTEGACATGATCFLLNGLEETACQAQSDCAGSTICVGGTCRAAACRPPECEGFWQGSEACAAKYAGMPQFSNGAVCLERADGSNTCVPAGPLQLGERCITRDASISAQSFTRSCGEGLSCVQGTCRGACVGDEDCADGASCLFASEDFVAAGVGVCGEPCEPFSIGACGQGRKCLPVGPEQGLCIEAGPLAAFDACIAGEERCEEGTMCAQTGGVGARCLPLCDVLVAGSPGQPAISPVDQARRDATCPQPVEVVVASLSVTHLAPRAPEVDLYLDDAAQPWIAGLGVGEVAPTGAEALTVPPGTRRVAARLAGEPASDVPFASLTVALSRDASRALVVAPSAPDDASPGVLLALPEVPAAAAGVVIAHVSPDAGALDIVSVAAGGALVASEPLARALAPRAQSVPAAREAGVYDLYVFDAGAPRTLERVLASARSVRLGDATLERLFVHGTRAEGDAPPLTLGALEVVRRPTQVSREGLLLSCADPGNGAWGACEQRCDGPSDYGAGVCDGEGMGCQPVQRDGAGWLHVCRASGTAPVGAPCDPLTTTPCQEGAYCLEFGSGDPEVAAGGPRGRCVSLCDASAQPAESELLGCAPGQICGALDARFEIGRCGYACEPGSFYRDEVACPAGLQRCEPRASVSSDPLIGGDLPPRVQLLPSLCAASGELEIGALCPGRDCIAGASCLYPRSAQVDLVSTLLSPYFGGAGLSPTCQPVCDPFDNDSASWRCAPTETCLVNFPWSAEVGHCAPMVEQVAPWQPCTRPGEACGQDSVCVIDGGAPFCLRLCQYAGGPAANQYVRSTCPAGFQCAPLAEEVGFCRAQ